ncbi:hypothetical protein D3C80_1554210 [compost metagenome]
MRVLWFHGLGEAQVAQGVFVGAVHFGVGRQCSQALQGGMHLLRGALEHPPATGSEQRVAAEQQGRGRLAAIERDMPEGMAGDGNDLEGQAQYADLVAVVQCHVTDRNTLAGRAADPGSGPLFELLDTADMVVVVVGDEDVLQHPTRMGVEPGDDRAGIAGIDHRASAFGSIL